MGVLPHVTLPQGNTYHDPKARYYTGEKQKTKRMPSILKWSESVKRLVNHWYTGEKQKTKRCLVSGNGANRSSDWWIIGTKQYFQNVAITEVALNSKTFIERQHPRSAAIRKCEHWLSVAVSNSNPLHGTLHHATKFQAIMWFPCISKMGHLPGPSLPWKILKFRRTPKNWPSMAMLNSGLLHGTVYHSAKFQADSWNP